MTKDATLQVRMDPALKADAEALFHDLGTSFAEAVRIFARQSVNMGAMPFAITLEPAGQTRMRGAAKKYANAALVPDEAEAWRRAARRKHAHIA